MRDFEAITDEDKSLIRKLCSAGEVGQEVTVLCLNVASQKESGEILFWCFCFFHKTSIDLSLTLLVATTVVPPITSKLHYIELSSESI